jgi:hypothetical protein
VLVLAVLPMARSVPSACAKSGTSSNKITPTVEKIWFDFMGELDWALIRCGRQFSCLGSGASSSF